MELKKGQGKKREKKGKRENKIKSINMNDSYKALILLCLILLRNTIVISLGFFNYKHLKKMSIINNFIYFIIIYIYYLGININRHIKVIKVILKFVKFGFNKSKNNLNIPINILINTIIFVILSFFPLTSNVYNLLGLLSLCLLLIRSLWCHNLLYEYSKRQITYQKIDKFINYLHNINYSELDKLYNKIF